MRILMFVLLIFAYLIFGVLRPLLRQLASPATTVTTLGALSPGATRAADGTIVDANGEPLDVVLGGTLADPAALSAAKRTLMIGNRITSARELAAQDPKLVANVVRTWIHTGSQTHE